MPEYDPNGIGGMPQKKEPKVPEWAGKYPNIYGIAGAAREAVQPFMRGSLIDVGLSKAVGYPTPEFMTKEEAMSLPISGGLFPKSIPIARPQVIVRQHPSGQWYAQQGGFGAEGKLLTSGNTMEEVMQKAKTMAPGHDIKPLKPENLPSVSKEEAIAELKRRGKWEEPQVVAPTEPQPEDWQSWSGKQGGQ